MNQLQKRHPPYLFLSFSLLESAPSLFAADGLSSVTCVLVGECLSGAQVSGSSISAGILFQLLRYVVRFWFRNNLSLTL